MAKNDLTVAIYEASKDPRVVALRRLSYEARYGAAVALDADGTGPIIDPEIDVVGWDPLTVMLNRTQLGLTWWRNVCQPIPINPLHFTSSQISDYDPNKPWPRSIKTSTNSADYPPFGGAPPAPPVVKPVGNLIGNGLYAVNQTACWNSSIGHWVFSEGAQQTASDGTPVFWHMGYFLGAPSPEWETAEARTNRLAQEATAVQP